MGLIDDVTQWVGDNIVRPAKKGRQKASDWLADFDPEGARQAIALMNPNNARDFIDAMPEETRGDVLDGSAGYDDFMGVSGGVNQSVIDEALKQRGAPGSRNVYDKSVIDRSLAARGGAAAEAAATDAAANTVLPGKKAGIIGKVLKWGIPAAAVAMGIMGKKGDKVSDKGLSDLITDPANGGGLEYTTEQAERAGRNKAATDAARSAETSAPKEEPFDINAIADKYSGEVSPSGGLLSDKKVSKQDGKSLVYKGFIKNEQTGKTTHIYGAKPQTEGAAPSTDTNGQAPTREGFYKVAVAQVKKNLGIDPDSFNPVTEAKKVLDSDGEYQYMKKRLSEGHFTPQKRAMIEREINDKEAQVTKELAYKATLAKDGVKRMMDMFDKQKDKFGVAPAGGTIYNKETGKPEATLPGKETGLASTNLTAIDKITERMFMDQADPSMVQMGGKVYESLPPAARANYDKVTEQAGRIMLDATKQGKSITPQEAVRTAMDTMKNAGTTAPKTKAEATAAIKQKYPGAADDKINAYLTKKFPNLK